MFKTKHSSIKKIYIVHLTKNARIVFSYWKVNSLFQCYDSALLSLSDLFGCLEGNDFCILFNMKHEQVFYLNKCSKIPKTPCLPQVEYILYSCRLLVWPVITTNCTWSSHDNFVMTWHDITPLKCWSVLLTGLYRYDRGLFIESGPFFL